MEIRKKKKWNCDNHKIDWDETKSVHISYPPGSLEQDWREEALRHREEIEHLQHDLESEQNKTTKLAKRITKALNMINTLKNETLIEDTGNTTTGLLYAKPCCRVRLNKIKEVLESDNNGETTNI